MDVFWLGTTFPFLDNKALVVCAIRLAWLRSLSNWIKRSLLFVVGLWSGQQIRALIANDRLPRHTSHEPHLAFGERLLWSQETAAERREDRAWLTLGQRRWGVVVVVDRAWLSLWQCLGYCVGGVWIGLDWHCDGARGGQGSFVNVTASRACA